LGRKTKLSPEITSKIVEAISGGAFDHVAAESSGISPSTYYSWMTKGASGEEKYSEFSEEVRTARAQARIKAETSVYKSDPKFWLRNGPGKGRPGEPGWTEHGPDGDSALEINPKLLHQQLRDAIDRGLFNIQEFDDDELLAMINGDTDFAEES
jgi:hypothetical protein